MIDVHRLSIFRSVVATGSVQGAARALNYTPSAVSQHISTLQKETGLLLLERSGRGLVPTQDGLAMAEQADRVLERVAEAEALAADLKAGRSGVLTVGYFGSLGETLLPGIMAELIAEFPTVRFDLRLLERDALDSSEPAPDVHVLIERPDWTPGSGLADPPPGLGALRRGDPRGHPLDADEPITLAELRPEPWIDNDLPGGRCREPLLRACAAEGFHPVFAVEAGDYRTALSFVAAGLGITIIARLGAVHLPPGVRSRPVIAPELERTVHVTVRTAALSHPAAQRAAELLGAALAD